jgi:hypothetical protein
MTKDEALKLALYALEIEDAACCYMKDETPSQIVKAITAIKQALAAPTVHEPVQTTGETNVELDFYSDATGNGQQRQLVGEMEMGQLMGGGPHKSAGNPDAKGEIAVIRGVDEYGPMLDWYEHWVNFPVGTRLYTTPPAAQPAAPLTDAQRRAIIAKLSEADYADGDEWDNALFDAIEAAHGITAQAPEKGQP